MQMHSCIHITNGMERWIKTTPCQTKKKTQHKKNIENWNTHTSGRYYEFLHFPIDFHIFGIREVDNVPLQLQLLLSQWATVVVQFDTVLPILLVLQQKFNFIQFFKNNKKKSIQISSSHTFIFIYIVNYLHCKDKDKLITRHKLIYNLTSNKTPSKWVNGEVLFTFELLKSKIKLLETISIIGIHLSRVKR